MDDKPYRFIEQGDYYLIDFEHDVKALSSAPFNGGFGFRSRYINRHVDHDYRGPVRTEVENFLISNKMDERGTVVTLTAAAVTKYVYMSKNINGRFIDLFLTAGFDNALSIGNPLGKPGTVNIAVITDISLNASAMVNLMQSIVEGKAQFMNDAKILDARTGKPCPGTSTDTVSIFVADLEGNVEYAGRLTEVGYYTSMIVYNSLMLSSAFIGKRACSPR
ncbi:hypothetical protein DMB44_05240 [Thermoplasma sp. Kam2015]|uniref:adenosylcobinamide amidohydrolase n=1 Tax=Thermoplasma sp. Kam2015 TaxID=2094122 RepID=UPI000D844542|nr:adenosylcobinamide amidohydrolase [Thermoplasma sp. Kam2015]PYB68240.1 hypothetical protein DMB44_05240 [Thermoplasma sp. Kam2015]